MTGAPTVEGDFARDGVACVRSLLTADEVATAERVIERVLAQPSALAIRASAADDAAFVEDFCTAGAIDELADLARSHRIGEVAARLTGSTSVRFHHDHVLVKEPGTRQRTPWHQDQPYYDIDGSQTVSFWIPVDPVPAETCLEVIAGTHLGPWFVPRTFLDHDARWFPEGSLTELPEIADDDPRIRRWRLEPGDAVAFHMAAVHGAPGVIGTDRRRVLSLRYVGDDVVHAPRPWTTSPPFPDLGLTPGGPLDHPRFPVVWPT